MSQKKHYYLFTFKLSANGQQWWDSIITGLPHPYVTMRNIRDVAEGLIGDAAEAVPVWLLTGTSYLGEMTAEEFDADCLDEVDAAG